MWYAQNAISSQSLNYNQLSMFKRYQRVEPFILQNYEDSQLDPFIKGVFVSFNLPGEEICFHYPSYRESAFSDINNTIIDVPYGIFMN